MLSSPEGKPNIRYRIWEHPKEGCFYAIGIDPAGPSERGSQSAMRCWKDRPRQLVAESCGMVTEEILASEAAKFGQYYNNAHLAVEVFSFGRTTLSLLLSGSDVYNIKPYPNIYRGPSTADLQAGIHRPTGSYGWSADPLRRRIMFMVARKALQFAKGNPGCMLDALALREYYNVIWVDGKPRAAPGERDDRVVADALAWLIFEQDLFAYPTDPKEQRKDKMFYIENNQIMFNPKSKPPKKEGERRLFA